MRGCKLARGVEATKKEEEKKKKGVKQMDIREELGVFNMRFNLISEPHIGLIPDICVDLLESCYAVRSEASEVLNTKIAVFCCMAPPPLGEGYRRFRVTCYLHHQVK
jgi:hypothetical protein